MSQYGPPGGMGNDPYGQQPGGGQWSGGAPNPPYQGAPGYGQAPGGGQDPFGNPVPDSSGPGVPPPGAGVDPFAQPPFGAPPPGPGQPSYGGAEQPSPPSGFEQPSPPGGFDQPGPPGGFGPPPPPAAGGQPWGPPPPPKKSHTGLIIVLVIVVVLVIGGGAGWYFKFGPGKSGSGKSDNKQASGPATGVKAGDCVVHPKKSQTVKPAKCSQSGALKVYKRFDHTTNKQKCPSPQTDFIYVYTDNSGGNNNFVLCLQSQGGKASASPSP